MKRWLLGICGAILMIASVFAFVATPRPVTKHRYDAKKLVVFAEPLFWVGLVTQAAGVLAVRHAIVPFKGWRE